MDKWDRFCLRVCIILNIVKTPAAATEFTGQKNQQNHYSPAIDFDLILLQIQYYYDKQFC